MTLNMIVTRVKRQSVAVPDTSMCSKRILDGSQRNGDLNHNQMLHAHTIAVAIVRMQMHRVSASRMAMKASQWMIADALRRGYAVYPTALLAFIMNKSGDVRVQTGNLNVTIMASAKPLVRACTVKVCSQLCLKINYVVVSVYFKRNFVNINLSTL